MRHRRVLLLLRLSISIVLVAGSMAATILVLNYLQPAKPTAKIVSVARPDTKRIVEPDKRVYSIPTKLTISKIGVAARILPMGLTATDDMEAPLTNSDTGWYKYGTRPGNEGSAVIDGHLGLSSEAVFGKLNQLGVGDIISVVDDQNSTISFKVRKTETYDRGSDTTDIFNSKSGSHLNLITCNGDWEAKQATYSKRLVIFSDRVDGEV